MGEINDDFTALRLVTSWATQKTDEFITKIKNYK